MLIDYIKMAVGNLLKRRLRSWLTLIGIFIGITAVVSLISLGEGMRIAIATQFNMLGSDIITVQAGGTTFGIPGSGAVNPLKKEYAGGLEKVNGVEYAINRLIKTSKAEFNDKTAIAPVGSMPSGEKRRIVEERLGLKAQEGRLLKDSDKGKVFLGAEFKKSEIFGKPVSEGDRIVIQGKQFEVVGIGKKMGNFIADMAILMNEDEMRDLYNDKDSVNIIVIKIKKGADINAVKTNIEREMRRLRNVKEGEEDFSVELSISAIKTLESTLFAVQLFVYIIAGISIIVGGIGIMNTMFTAVVERTKEIGILKSIGARNSDVFVIFLVESGLLGSVGGLAGIIVGYIISNGLAYAGSVYFGSNLIKADVSLWLTLSAFIFSFFVGCIAGITPALRAASLHPVEALRK